MKLRVRINFIVFVYNAGLSLKKRALSAEQLYKLKKNQQALIHQWKNWLCNQTITSLDGFHASDIAQNIKLLAFVVRFACRCSLINNSLLWLLGFAYYL